jgi:acetyltransferase-like isoleucine patch superfamily enzyme
MSDTVIGGGLEADDGVTLGYQPSRPSGGGLVLGPDARVRLGTILYADTTIGARFETGHYVVVREGCTIGDDVSIWNNSVVDYDCELGDGVKIHNNCYVAQYTQIGPRSFLAPGVITSNDLYPGQPGSAAEMGGPTLGADVQVGVNATILPYVTIGDGSIIGAGAVVTRDIPPGTLAYGNPARPRGSTRALGDVRARVVVGEGGRRRLRGPSTRSREQGPHPS